MLLFFTGEGGGEELEIMGLLGYPQQSKGSFLRVGAQERLSGGLGARL